MNKRIVFSYIGRMMQFEAALFTLPVFVAIYYKEKSIWSFLISAMVALAIGTTMTLFAKPQKKNLFVKEGFVIVAFSWILLSLVGALPFVISGEIPNYVDALFETISGFTTTGATILDNVEALSRGMLFWRSFTHFIGGMGVLVLVMAILPIEGSKSIHLMRAEMPGPVVGKLVPKVRGTALILYIIYVAMTVIMAIMLLCGGMPIFHSVCIALGTAGTGGFGVLNSSCATYSPYLQWVITIFMLLFGINFNLYYLILVGKIKTALSSRELWFYGAMVGSATIAISCNIYSIYGNISETVRDSAFHVASLVSSTGFSTQDINGWPQFSKSIMIMLMFVGACAGSTAGGLKVSRVIMLFKILRRDLKKTLHPRQVSLVKFEGKKIDDQTISNVSSYFIVYTVIFAVVCFILSMETRFDFEASFTATLSALNNIGPFFSSTHSVASFSEFSVISKLALSAAMLLGRLEIYPLLFAVSPSTWIEK